MCKKCSNCPLGEGESCSNKKTETAPVPPVLSCEDLCGDCAQALTVGNDEKKHCTHCEPQFFS